MRRIRLKLFLYAFTVTTSYDEYMMVKEDILLRVASIVREHGAELAVPTSTVHIPDGLRFQSEPSSAGPERFIEGISPQPG